MESVVSEVVEVESVVAFAVVSAVVSEENVAVRGEGKGAVSDCQYMIQEAHCYYVSGFRGRGERRNDGERGRGSRGRGRGRGGEQG